MNRPDAPDARRAAAATPAFEALARRLLSQLGRLSGLDSTYVTLIDTDHDVQEILYSHNAGGIEIREGLRVVWSDTLCRRALDGGPACTSDVASVYPDSETARELGLQTYVTVPIQDVDGTTFGTLCGASARSVDVSETTRLVMETLSEMIAGELVRESGRRQLADANIRLEQARQAARRERDFLTVVLGSMREGFYYTVDGVITDVNEPLCRLTGFGRDELIGRDAQDLFGPDDHGGDREVVLERRDGSAFPAAVVSRPTFTADGRVEGLITIVSDLTAVKSRESHLLDIASRDAMTGLFNRRAIDERVADLRAGDSVVILDLDHFKSVNDTDGHAAGDRVITGLAECIGHVLRDGDWGGRLGGEEFIVVLRRSGHDGAVSATDRLRQVWTATGPRTTFSAGIAVHEAGAEPRQTIARADEALYQAKRNGRDRTEAFIPPRPAGGVTAR